MKKILVLGKDGQLGSALQRIADSDGWKFLDKDSINLYETATIVGKLEREDFDILINCAAYTAVDKAEDEPDIAQRINAGALAPISEICRKKNAVLVHISTDYVFGEVPPAPISEDAPTAPIGVYGKTKLAGEETVRNLIDQHIIIRTSWLYGIDGNNFLKTMLKLATTQNELQVVNDQFGSPTFVDYLAKAIYDIVQLDTLKYGTYHYSNEGECSWYDFAYAIFELAGIEIHVEPVDSSTFPTKAKRPNYSVLDKTKIKDTFGIEIPYWRNGVKACLHKMDKLK